MGQASVCDMVATCPDCDINVSFADNMILYQFVQGLNDVQMQERILESAAQVDTGKLSLSKVVKIAKAFVMGKNSQELVNNGGAQISRISQYQKNKTTYRQSTQSQSSKSTSDKPKCGNCGRSDHTSKMQDRRENCPASDKMCQKCITNGHFSSQCRGGPWNLRDESTEKPKNKDKKVNEVKEKEKESDDAADFDTMTGSWMLINGLQNPASQRQSYKVSDEYSSEQLETKPLSSSSRASLATLSKKDFVKKLHHHIKDEFGKWKPSNVQPHGKVNIQLEVAQSVSQQLNIPIIRNVKTTTVHALADTGAQMCVADWGVAKQMGLSKSNLMVPALSVSVADNSSLELIGATFIKISSTSGKSSEQLVYFALLCTPG